MRLRCLRAAFAFARRLRSLSGEWRGELPSTSSPSVAGATRRASRTITKPIPIRSNTATPVASRITLFELVFSEDEVVVVFAVLVVSVGSEEPSVSSLSAPPVPKPVASAAGAHALTSASSAVRHSAHAHARRLRQWESERLATRRAYRLREPTPRTGAARTPPPAALRPHAIEWPPMAPKQRQVRLEQRGALEAIQALEQRSDEELEAETKYKAAALAILGARASERFDAEAARGYFQRAIAAARPQERMQIRRMADASLALAERRAGDLKDAVQRMGQTPPSGRQMFALRAMGLLLPPSSAGILARVRGILLIIVVFAAFLAIGLGIVELISLPFGGIGLAPGILLGLFVVIAVLAIVAAIGRRRRNRAKAAPPA